MTVYIGIDVGSGGARAGAFDAEGQVLASSQSSIDTWRPRSGYAQQSSREIWRAVATAVREAVSSSRVDPSLISGIGFDATCSLVVSDGKGEPVSVDPDGDPDQDVIVWSDHRADVDAAEINRIGGTPLKYIGGVISPEMQLPKLRWLKREVPASWAQAEAFRDLSDWLVFRASGSQARSLCTAVCKWTYLGHEGGDGQGWDETFLTEVGLGELARDRDYHRIGHRFVPPGTCCGGLTQDAAKELGLPAGLPVGAGLIDAHAGALGTLAVGARNPDTRLAVIAGTSTCHIALSEKPVFIPGVWGPYFGAVTPGSWCLEGGQSAAGALLDAVIRRHAASASVVDEADSRGMAELLEGRLQSLAEESATLTARRHIQPDIHGNRSPLAEPWRRAALDGLTLETGLDDLALDYLAAIQALSYGTRQIIEAIEDGGVRIETIVASGGLAHNRLFVREMADATGRTVLVPETPEPVLLGSAMLGAVAAGQYSDAAQAMAAMAPTAREVLPRGGAIARYHTAKYTVFRKMQEDHATYASIMEETGL